MYIYPSKRQSQILAALFPEHIIHPCDKIRRSVISPAAFQFAQPIAIPDTQMQFGETCGLLFGVAMRLFKEFEVWLLGVRLVGDGFMVM